MNRPAHRQTPVPINKIIKQDGSYICGICRKHHDNKQVAHACLRACYQAYIGKQDIKEDSSGSKKFRCSICKRIYDDRNIAVKCLKDCSQSSQVKSEKQSSSIINQYQQNPLQSLDANDKTIEKLKKKLDEEKKKSVPTETSINYGKTPPNPSGKTPLKDQVASTINYSSTNKKGTSDDNLQRIGDEIHEGYKEDSFEQKDTKNFKSIDRSNMHKFTRDGRKLYCKKCGDEFTKMEEVVACYDAHPENEKGRKATDEDKKKFRKNGSDFECKYCGNAFTVWPEAIECYDSHQDKSEKTIKTKADANEKDKFTREGAKYLCSACHKGYFTKMEAVGCYDGHAEDPKAAESPAAKNDDLEGLEDLDGDINWDDAFGEAGSGDEGSETANEVPDIDIHEGREKFSRDGAKYVCNKCNEKYFTRMEVIQCYDGH